MPTVDNKNVNPSAIQQLLGGDSGTDMKFDMHMLTKLSSLSGVPGAAPLFDSLIRALEKGGAGLVEIFQDVMKDPKILLSTAGDPAYDKAFAIVKDVIFSSSRDLFSTVTGGLIDNNHPANELNKPDLNNSSKESSDNEPEMQPLNYKGS